MKVIFTQDVAGKGRRGEVKNVAAGYAENFLIRTGKARRATKSTVSKLRAQKHAENRDEAEAKKAAEDLKAKLESGKCVVVLSAKCGKDGRLFGSVTSKQIVQGMKKQHGITLNKRKLDLKDPIRSLGYMNVPVKLHKGITAQVRVHVTEKK
ncbi:50S ribosomal protein L9 [Acetilactobacillus jinshanensis]|uniref:Large ribosomal subunit protein bL9 n=1 Tax=Acetilactobacillus jinshanensis TaxID=1720083 RepID=A0A4P6ZIT5_9LACO|nr:50S ribosomal protein L9 [Acetilactobacillus jinshanensis]QBP17611.1 50S ribosomal protein L9 [Acetilactobacillus jinshanensis]URL61845.1 50S ribosomal protein L9 [uncultured bacterium]